MSKFFLGPNFSEKVAMGSVNPISVNPPEQTENIETEQTQQEETEKTEIKKKDNRNGKESGLDKSV